MMERQSHIINILTYKLPFDLANQIFNEYQGRIKEAEYIIEINTYYAQLRQDKSVVEILLALSIFHKRVISNLDGAVKFYNTVTTKSETDTIKIGSYKLNGDEKNNILALLITYRAVLDRFAITLTLFDYSETKEFLKNVINYKRDLKNDNLNRRNIEDDLTF